MENAIRPVPAPRELTVFGAMWRYRRLVGVIVVVAVAAAVVYDVTRSRVYVAEASLILQQPSASNGAPSLGAQEAARYTTDQLTILRSPALAEKALETTRDQLPGTAATKRDFRTVDLTSSGDSNVIAIRFSASSPRLAVIGADAIGRSYEGVRQQQVAVGAAKAVERVDTQIATINRRLGEVSNELAGLQAEPADDPRVTKLSQEQTTLLEQRATLLQQRSQLSASSRAPGQVSILIPADRSVTQTKSELPRLIAVALFLGLLVGAAVAYALSLRRRTFDDGAEIEMVVAAPMLGEIPDFSRASGAPVRPDVVENGGPAEEAFRLVASAVGSRAELVGATTLMVVSALRGDGRTTVAANVAMAAAVDGARVLVVDADPRRRALSAMFTSVTAAPLRDQTLSPADGSGSVPGAESFAGNGQEALDLRPERVLLMATSTLDLLSMVGSPASNAWRSEPVRRYFQATREAYDLVLIDTPDLLSASDAAAIAVHADAAIVVVPEHSGVAEVTEVIARLRLVGIAPLGYVHNLASSTVRRKRREGVVSAIEQKSDDSRLEVRVAGE